MRRHVYFIGTQQLASMLKFTTLHSCNVVYLQHGEGSIVDRMTSVSSYVYSGTEQCRAYTTEH